MSHSAHIFKILWYHRRTSWRSHSNGRAELAEHSGSGLFAAGVQGIMKPSPVSCPIGGLNHPELSKSMTTGICLLCFYHGKFTVSNRSIIHQWAIFIHFPYITRGCTSKITGTVRRSTAARLVARTSCNLGWPTGLPRSAGLPQKTCWDIRSSLGCVSNHGSTWITWNFRTRTLRYYTSTM